MDDSSILTIENLLDLVDKILLECGKVGPILEKPKKVKCECGLVNVVNHVESKPEQKWKERIEALTATYEQIKREGEPFISPKKTRSSRIKNKTINNNNNDNSADMSDNAADFVKVELNESDNELSDQNWMNIGDEDENDRLEKQFRCGSCNSVFSSKNKLAYHKRKVHPKVIYKCSFPGCNYVTSQSKRHLRRHAFNHGTEIHQCSHEGCSYKTNNPIYLLSHVRSYHEAGDKPGCPWPGCEFKPRAPSLVAAHFASHTGVSTFNCTWPGCSRTFRYKSSLNSHQAIHLDGKKYKCSWPGCESAFSYGSDLTKHLKRHEGFQPEKKFICEWPNCSKRYTKQTRLAEHQRSIKDKKIAFK